MNFGLQSYGIHGDLTGNPDAKAIVARFRNHGDRIDTARSVKATLRFKRADNTEIASINGPLWVNGGNVADIAPDDTKSLTLLMKASNGRYIVPGLRRVYRRGRAIYFPDELRMDELPERAEVRLRDGSGEGDLLLAHDVYVYFTEEDSELKVRGMRQSDS